MEDSAALYPASLLDCQLRHVGVFRVVYLVTVKVERGDAPASKKDLATDPTVPRPVSDSFYCLVPQTSTCSIDLGCVVLPQISTFIIALPTAACQMTSLSVVTRTIPSWERPVCDSVFESILDPEAARMQSPE